MNKIALRKLLVRIINDIITPICNETAFFCIVTFMMYISHLLNVWTTDMSIMYVRNLFIGLSSAIFISWFIHCNRMVHSAKRTEMCLLRSVFFADDYRLLFTL